MNADRAIRHLNMKKAAEKIAAYQAALATATPAEQNFLRKIIQSNQQVVNEAQAMTDAGY
jgi:hypothetical protein